MARAGERYSLHVNGLPSVLMLVSRPAPTVRPLPRLRDIASELPLCHASVRAAFEAEQFEIAYQPILCADSLQPVACEALLRWTHPSRGAQLPREFVPILERSNLVLAVGDWVLEESARQVLDWDRQGFPPLRLAVNVAAAQLFAPDFAARVDKILGLTGLAPERLALEVSQDVLHGRSDAGPALARLAQLGVSLELDDFGGGPSMLARRDALAIGGIKLDRRFIAGLADERSGAHEDVRILAGIARERGLRCIAEGVQTESELEALRALGVSEVQGFLFSKAVAPAAFERFLHAQRASLPRALPTVGGTART